MIPNPPTIDLDREMAAKAAENKFIRLRDEWKGQRRHEPSTPKVVLIPAYQKIIGMGQTAIPFLLRELETNLDAWFWALMMITEENPVTEDFRGDGESMAQAWIQWGKDRGYELSAPSGGVYPRRKTP